MITRAVSTVAPRRPFAVPLPGRDPLELGPRTLIMGVLNVTPDSFSDGGALLDPARALDRALQLEAEGADILDIGGESTRPGAESVDAAEEWRRVGPVLERLAGRLRVPLSIDTYRAATAERAFDQGVAIVNDVSALTYDAGLGPLVAVRGAALVLMHNRGRSRDMYGEATYEDVVQEIAGELQQGLDRAIEWGVARDRVILDPGFGFAKKAAHSLTALAHLEAFAALGRPLLSGPSRKSFLTSVIGKAPPHERDWATAAAVTQSVLAGAHIVRVHRVAEMVHVVRVADAIRRAASA
jgi:dihydropteroate synthase